MPSGHVYPCSDVAEPTVDFFLKSEEKSQVYQASDDRLLLGKKGSI
jgi:hypothetical protein